MKDAEGNEFTPLEETPAEQARAKEFLAETQAIEKAIPSEIKSAVAVSLCRMVVYHSNVHGHVEDHAAVVIRVYSPSCAKLKVFGPNGDYTVDSVVQGEEYGQEDRWSWPPRV